MDNVNKMIKITGSALLFCIGLLVMIYEARAYTVSLNLTREMMKEDVLYQQYNISNRELISYAELIAILLQPLEYDILIDDRLISKEEHDKYRIAGYGLNNCDYQKSYRYDENGSITMILYTSIG